MDECIRCHEETAEQTSEIYHDDESYDQYDSVSYVEYRCSNCDTVFRLCTGIVHFEHIIMTTITAGDILGVGMADLEHGGEDV